MRLIILNYLYKYIYNYMGNLLAYPLIDNTKSVSKILELEGWSLIYKNGNYVYYNKFKNIEISDYPESISDYNDIINFYNTELLESYETVDLLEDYIYINSSILMEEDINKIQCIKKKIKEEIEVLPHVVGLCFS